MAFISKRPGGVWHIFYQDSKGRTRSKTTKTQDEAIARRRLRLFEKELAEGTIQSLDTTAGEFDKEYRKWATAHGHSRLTIDSQIQRWRTFAAWKVRNAKAKNWKSMRLSSVKRADIERFLSDLTLGRGRGPKARPLTKNSRNNYLRDLRALYNHAIRDLELFDGDNPAQGIKLVKPEVNPPPYISQEQIDALLQAAKAHSEAMYLWCFVGLYLGLRKGEAGKLRWEWFDWEKRLLNLPSTEQSSLKSHRARSIPLQSSTAAILQRYAEPEGFVFNSAKWNCGKAIYRYDPKKAFAAVKAEAKLPKLRYHDLRHTYATQQTLAGTPTKFIQMWMGHASEATTARYQHVLGYNDAVNNFAPNLDNEWNQ